MSIIFGAVDRKPFSSSIFTILFWLLVIIPFVSCQKIPHRIQSIRPFELPETVIGKKGKTDISRMLSQNGVHPSKIGYIVYDIEDDKIVQKHNETILFPPASTSKLLVAIAALSILGPNYRFSTQLRYTGKIKNGVLDGDLYLVGTGDPVLFSNDLMAMAESLSQIGLTKVNGNLYYDDYWLTSTQKIEPDQFDQLSYNPGISALSCEFNRFKLFWQPIEDASDFDVEIFGTPLYPHKSIILGKHKALSEKKFLFTSPGPWSISHELPNRGSKRLPVKNPSLFTSNLFRNFCKILKIDIGAPSPNRAPKSSQLLYTHQSPPLHKIVADFLEYSNNLSAELVLLNTARFLGNKPLSLKDSALKILDWYKRKLPHVSWKGIDIRNGSGLTAKSKISPMQLLEILRFVQNKKFAQKSFMTYLPISGIKGTLQKRLTIPHTSLKVWAKTGSMNYISTLAGYFFSKSNKKYAFVIFNEDLKRRNGFFSKKNPFAKARKWTMKMQKIQDDLITGWIVNN